MGTQLRTGSLFSGYGGLDLAIHSVLGAEPGWFCEYEPPTDTVPNPGQGAAKILAHRWPDVPNLGDITAVDWGDVEPVDILTGGFPCTDISVAGRRAGLTEGTRSGLWSHFATAISVLRPKLVVIENVRALTTAKAGRGDAPDPPLHPLLRQTIEETDAETTTDPAGDDLGSDDTDMGGDDGRPVLLRALGAVLGDLADLGYDAAWHGLHAASIGAPHPRFRIFILAWPAEDADSPAGRQRRITTPRQAEGWRARTDPGRRDRTPPADTGRDPRPQDDPHESAAARRGRTAVDTPGQRRDQRRAEPARLGRGPDAALRGAAAADAYRDALRDQPVPEPGSDGPPVAELTSRDWGPYTAAITRWEHVLGRPAPAPTEPGRTGQRLSPRFTEWMMGLPDGWVCDVPGLTRNDQLKALGNGVVPQQGTAALQILLGNMRQATNMEVS